MQAKGVTAAVVARAVGVSTCAVTNWLRGFRRPTAAHASAVVVVLGELIKRDLAYEEVWSLTPHYEHLVAPGAFVSAGAGDLLSNNFGAPPEQREDQP